MPALRVREAVHASGRNAARRTVLRGGWNPGLVAAASGRRTGGRSVGIGRTQRRIHEAARQRYDTASGTRRLAKRAGPCRRALCRSGIGRLRIEGSRAGRGGDHRTQAADAGGARRRAARPEARAAVRRAARGDSRHLGCDQRRWRRRLARRRDRLRKDRGVSSRDRAGHR